MKFNIGDPLSWSELSETRRLVFEPVGSTRTVRFQVNPVSVACVFVQVGKKKRFLAACDSLSIIEFSIDRRAVVTIEGEHTVQTAERVGYVKSGGDTHTTPAPVRTISPELARAQRAALLREMERERGYAEELRRLRAEIETVRHNSASRQPSDGRANAVPSASEATASEPGTSDETT